MLYSAWTERYSPADPFSQNTRGTVGAEWLCQKKDTGYSYFALL